jgi:hypothetical protein
LPVPLIELLLIDDLRLHGLRHVAGVDILRPVDELQINHHQADRQQMQARRQQDRFRVLAKQLEH